MEPTLDRIDRALLKHLQNDARQTNRELAQKVGLAPSSCLHRVRRLTESGVIHGTHADVDPKALSVGLQAMVQVRVVRHHRDVMQRLWDHVTCLPEVRDVYYLAGAEDLLVHVAVRDVDHLRELVSQNLSSREEVGHIQTSLVFEHRRRFSLPDYGPDED